MNKPLFLVCGLMITGCGSPSATEDVGTKTAAIEPDPGSGPGNPSFITYPQLYASADGETHFREVTVPLTFLQPVPPAQGLFYGPREPATARRWVVFPKHWGVDEFQQGVFHNISSRRFVSIREGTIVIRVSDGEERIFKKGDILEALDVAPSKGRLSKSEDGAVVFLTDHL